MPRAAYIHVPFCRHRCGYCNFTVVAGRDDLADAYLHALSTELARLETPREVDTLFIGGGTPTHLSGEQLEQLLGLVNRWFPQSTPLAPRDKVFGGWASSPSPSRAQHGLQPWSRRPGRPSPDVSISRSEMDTMEFSVEANPRDALDVEKLAILRQHGVSRVSLGAQSFHDDKLRILERDHDATVIERAVANVREGGMDVSLDLIFGTPGETLEGWRDDLRQAIALAPDHLSTYGLTFEKGTAFWNRLSHGELAQADEELERAMYVTAIDTLVAAGFEHYEVSNFARPAHRCRHNETYWLGREYYAAGPGAARFVDGRRETNHRSTTAWIQRILAGESPIADSETLTADDRARERLVFGLRRLEGIEIEAFAKELGISLDALAGAEIARFREQGLLEIVDGKLRLTRAGLLVSDAIWPYFLR